MLLTTVQSVPGRLSCTSRTFAPGASSTRVSRARQGASAVLCRSITTVKWLFASAVSSTRRAFLAPSAHRVNRAVVWVFALAVIRSVSREAKAASASWPIPVETTVAGAGAAVTSAPLQSALQGPSSGGRVTVVSFMCSRFQVGDGRELTARVFSFVILLPPISQCCLSSLSELSYSFQRRIPAAVPWTHRLQSR